MIQKLKHRLKLVIYGAKRLKEKHAEQLHDLEIGWRVRFKLEEEKNNKIRHDLHGLMKKMTQAEMSPRDRTGPQTLRMMLSFDERMFRELADPHYGDNKHLIHFFSREMSVMLERELSTMNFATLQGHIQNANRRMYDPETLPAYLW